MRHHAALEQSKLSERLEHLIQRKYRLTDALYQPQDPSVHALAPEARYQELHRDVASLITEIRSLVSSIR